MLQIHQIEEIPRESNWQKFQFIWFLQTIPTWNDEINQSLSILSYSNSNFQSNQKTFMNFENSFWMEWISSLSFQKWNSSSRTIHHNQIKSSHLPHQTIITHQSNTFPQSYSIESIWNNSYQYKNASFLFSQTKKQHVVFLF